MNRIINGCFSGTSLTAIEKLCIRSFQDNGHEFHLWTPDAPAGVPDGTVCHRTQDIIKMPRDRFTGPDHFSDYFRSWLIYKRGGWYVDMDIVCLKPFDFESQYVFVSETNHGAMRRPTDPPGKIEEEKVVPELINGCIFKAPANAPFLAWIIMEISKRDVSKLPVKLDGIEKGIGPPMFRKGVPLHRLMQHVQPPVVFDGLDVEDYPRFTQGQAWELSPKSYAIHLRSSYWRSPQEIAGLRPDRQYPAYSLFEKLKAKHGVIL